MEFDRAFIGSAADDLPKKLVFDGIITQQADIESSRFIIAIRKSMGIDISCLGHVQFPCFLVHLPDKSGIACSL